MRFLGGKGQIGNRIAKIINENPGEVYVEPFFGSGSVARNIKGFEKAHFNDIHTSLINLWKAVMNGWKPPAENVTEDIWRHWKENKKHSDDKMAAFLGYGCSWGGRFFESFARSSDSRNYAQEAVNSLMKKASDLHSNFESIEWTSEHYRDISIPSEAIIYCDPPYVGHNNNTKLSQNEDFDHSSFWDWAARMSREHLVFVSFYLEDCIVDWEPVTNYRIKDRNTKDEIKKDIEFLETMERDINHLEETESYDKPTVDDLKQRVMDWKEELQGLL